MRNRQEVAIVGDNHFTAVDHRNDRMWKVTAVAQRTEPPCMHSPVYAGDEWQQLNRQSNDLLDRGLAVSRPGRKLRGIVQSENVQLMQGVEGSSYPYRAFNDKSRKRLHRSMPCRLDGLSEGVGQQNGRVEVDHLPPAGPLLSTLAREGATGFEVGEDTLGALSTRAMEQPVDRLPSKILTEGLQVHALIPITCPRSSQLWGASDSRVSARPCRSAARATQLADSEPKQSFPAPFFLHSEGTAISETRSTIRRATSSWPLR